MGSLNKLECSDRICQRENNMIANFIISERIKLIAKIGIKKKKNPKRTQTLPR